MMDGRRIFAGTLVLLVVVSAVAIFAAGGNQGNVQAPVASDTGEYNVTNDGTRYTVHPREIQRGCPGGMDCIPSIDNPKFQTARQADWLNDGDLVIGLEVNGETKAYPLRILNAHEIVNDRIGGKPVAVTYCPLCRSGLVFDRRLDDTTMTFGVSGKLFNANLVMYDRQTETYWSQLTGDAIVGELVPRSLEILPNSITTWEQWQNAHPQTLVLSRDTGIYPVQTYNGNPYSGYANSSRVGFGVGDVDGRLPVKEVVFGVEQNNASVAYPSDIVREQDAINDVVGDTPVLVVEDPDDGSVRVFVREHGNETLEFEASGDVLVDQHGNEWSYRGEALSGPNEGAELEEIPTHGIYWFAWSSFNPKTDVYTENTS